MIDPMNKHDIMAQRREWHITPPARVTAWLLTLLVDPRDLPIAYLFVNVLVFVLPSAVFVLYAQSHFMGVLYMATNIAFFYERFLLALHFSAHRRLTHSGMLNAVPEFLFAPIFGVPPGVYKIHHLSIHHKGNNRSDKDFTSTEQYQRDNVLHFLHYWIKFIIYVYIGLPLYLYKNGKTLKLYSIVNANLAFVCTCYVVNRLSSVGVWYVFFLPIIVSSFFTSFGNFSQHIFIDSDCPDRNHALTYSIINSTSNQQNFNDGYHVAHHEFSGMHFTELPGEFHKHIEKYAEVGSIVFENTSFFEIGFCVFMQDYETLYSRWVSINTDENKTRCEVEFYLRQRLKPIHRKAI